jgi:hypothetical protein
MELRAMLAAMETFVQQQWRWSAVCKASCRKATWQWAIIVSTLVSVARWHFVAAHQRPAFLCRVQSNKLPRHSGRNGRITIKLRRLATRSLLASDGASDARAACSYGRLVLICMAGTAPGLTCMLTMCSSGSLRQIKSESFTRCEDIHTGTLNRYIAQERYNGNTILHLEAPK